MEINNKSEDWIIKNMKSKKLLPYKVYVKSKISTLNSHLNFWTCKKYYIIIEYLGKN